MSELLSFTCWQMKSVDIMASIGKTAAAAADPEQAR